MKMKTQNDRLLNYLSQGYPINPMIALSELGIFRLAARISDLRRAGVLITSKRVEVSNRYGEKCNVSQYRMIRGA